MFVRRKWIDAMTHNVASECSDKTELYVFFLSFLILMILFRQPVCLCAEGKRPGGHSAAHPMADTQSGGRAAEDQSRCEKGRQFVSWNTEVHVEATV